MFDGSITMNGLAEGMALVRRPDPIKDAELDDDGGQTILLFVVPLREDATCAPMTLRAAKGAPRRNVPPWAGCENRIQFRTPSGTWSEPGSVAQAVDAIVLRQRRSQTRV